MKKFHSDYGICNVDLSHNVFCVYVLKKDYEITPPK